MKQDGLVSLSLRYCMTSVSLVQNGHLKEQLREWAVRTGSTCFPYKAQPEQLCKHFAAHQHITRGKWFDSMLILQRRGLWNPLKSHSLFRSFFVLFLHLGQHLRHVEAVNDVVACVAKGAKEACVYLQTEHREEHPSRGQPLKPDHKQKCFFWMDVFQFADGRMVDLRNIYIYRNMEHVLNTYIYIHMNYELYI